MVQDTLQHTIFGNTILAYIIALAIVLIGVFLVKGVKGILLSRLEARAEETSSSLWSFLAASLRKSLFPVLYFGSFYAGVRSLDLSQGLEKIVDGLAVIIFTFLGIRFVATLFDQWIVGYWIEKEKDPVRKISLKAFLPIVKVLVWSVGIVFLLDNLGFEISAVLAGLGIGGIAVALAAQAVLGDLLGYLTILFDRPFDIGDFVIVGDFMGSVEHVGIKTTRIRSLSGEQLIFSNKDITDSRLHNYKRMDKRRIVFSFGVTYQTGSDQLREIPEIVKNIIEGIEDTNFDRAHFASYGDFSLNFEVVYYVLSPDYNKYMDTQQKINFALKEEFEKRGVDFAYPTQTLFLEKAQLAEAGR
jgi:small-conductance mechanosensitive channel